MINTVPLGEVADVAMGSAPPGESYNETGNGIPMIAGAGDYGEQYPEPKKWTTTPTRVTEVGDLIICVRASIGDLNWADKRYCLGRGVAGLRAKEGKLDIKYAAHYINLKKEDLSKLSNGSTFLAIRRADLEEFPIPLPPLAEQRRIAAILDKADVIRRKRQAAITLADDFLRATFLDMFGDPITNPKGWGYATLGDFIHSAKDGPHVSPNYSESGIPFLSTRHVRPGKIIWKDLKYISRKDAIEQWKKCKPERGDILYTKGGTTGIAAVFDSDKEIAVWVHVALLKTNHKKADPIWLENMLNTSYCYAQSQRFTHGITNKDLGLTRMIKIKMYFPPLSLQKGFSEIVTKVKTSVAKFLSCADQSEDLFSSLTQRAFRGEL